MATTIWTVIEHDEDGIATQWRSAFTNMQEALSAVEAHSDQAWVDAEMGGEAPALIALPTGDDEIVVDQLNETVSWMRWTVTRVTIG